MHAEAAALRLTKSFFEELLLVVEAGERRRLSKLRETMESQNISSEQNSEVRLTKMEKQRQKDYCFFLEPPEEI